MPQRRIVDPTQPTSQPITWGDGTRATETNQIDAPPVTYSDMPPGPGQQTPGWPGLPPDKNDKSNLSTGGSPIDPVQTPPWAGGPPDGPKPTSPDVQTPMWPAGPGLPPNGPVIGDPQWPESPPPVKPGPMAPMQQTPGFPGPRPPLGIQDMLQQVIQPVRKQGPTRRRLR